MAREKRSYHHGGLREALVGAGTAILEKQGLGGLSLRAIARAAGVSHAAPHHHFETLADLLAEIAARGFERFVAQLARKSEGSATPETKLDAMSRAYVDFALENPAVYELMFRQGSKDLDSAHLGQAASAAWRQLEDAVAAIDPENAQQRAAFVWSAVHGLATLLIDKRFPPSVDVRGLIDANAARIAKAVGTI
ncbi:MAG: TetR/AcrR family transcriptional regulator [Aestuariivirga sp.]